MRATDALDRMPPSEDREQEFWDEHVPDLDVCVQHYRLGPSPNTAAMIAAVSPLADRRVLDFACGPGVTSAWLAERGANVTGVDISPQSIQRARELTSHLGLSATFTTAHLTDLQPDSFDAIIGQYALHHVDLTLVAPLLKSLLKAGGVGVFVETMGLNPILSAARDYLAGRAKIASYGSHDERPLRAADLELLGRVFGEVELDVAQLTFLRIFDRNVMRFRNPGVSRVLGAIDDWILRRGFGRLSYHQVVKVRKLYS